MRKLLFTLISLQVFPAPLFGNTHTQKQVALFSQLQLPSSAEQALRLMNCVFSGRGYVLEIIDAAPKSGPYFMAADNTGAFELYWLSSNEALPKPLFHTSTTPEELCQNAMREIVASEKITSKAELDLRPSLAASAISTSPLTPQSTNRENKSFLARHWPVLLASGLLLGAASALLIQRSKQQTAAPEIIFVD